MGGNITMKSLGNRMFVRQVILAWAELPEGVIGDCDRRTTYVIPGFRSR